MKEGGFVRKDFQDFVDIINNVIFDKEIDASEINLEKIYLLAKSHNMRTLLFCFIKKHFKGGKICLLKRFCWDYINPGQAL